jgi:hypothetical protein
MQTHSIDGTLRKKSPLLCFLYPIPDCLHWLTENLLRERTDMSVREGVILVGTYHSLSVVPQAGTFGGKS